MSLRCDFWAMVGLGCGVVATWAPGAQANGRMPGAQYALVGPGPASMVIAVRTTFGVLVSDDGGGTFHFLCEESLGFLDGYDPALEIGGDGTLLVGDPDGLVATADRCTTARRPELEGWLVADLAADATGNRVIAALVSRDALPSSRVARSMDGGRTFILPMAPLAGVSLQTVDIATTDGQRLYATGVARTSTTDPGRALFYRSDDAGETWRATAAGFQGSTGSFVAGVSPVQPDVVYVRATTTGMTDAGGPALGTALLRSDDAGEHFHEIARTVGPMNGFALAADGRTVWLGGPQDGLQRSRDNGPFTPVSSAPIECLRWHPEAGAGASGGALYACESFRLGGTLLARSLDDGATLVPLVRFDTLQGPPRCGADTLVEQLCPATWLPVRARIAPQPAMDAAVTDVPDGPAPAPAPANCGCRVATAPSRGAAGTLAGCAVAVLALCARRRTRSAS